nr:hypothetical protein [Tanacetum cinerariifolium]
EWVSDSEDESETTAPQIAPSFVQTSEHVKPFGHFDQPVEAPILAATPKPTSPKTNCSSTRKNRKTCFVCRSVDHLIKDCNFHAKPKPQPTPRNYAHRGHTKQNASFPQKHVQKHMAPTAVLTRSKIQPSGEYHAVPSPITGNFMPPKPDLTSNSPPKVTAAKALVVSVAQGMKGKWNNIDAAQPKLMLLVYMVTTAEVNREVTTDN